MERAGLAVWIPAEIDTGCWDDYSGSHSTTVNQEHPHPERQVEELRAGSFEVAATATEADRERLAQVFVSHGGSFINHYGRWAFTRLEE